MGSRFHLVEVEGVEVGRVVEDGSQLRGEGLQFVRSQFKSGQSSHMGDLVGRDPLGHGSRE